MNVYVFNIFSTLIDSKNTVVWMVFAWSFTQVPFTLISPTLINKFGKRTMMIASQTVIGVSLLVIAITLDLTSKPAMIATVLCMFLVPIFFKTGITAIIYQLIFLYLPPKNRMITAAFAGTLSWLFAFTLSLVHPVLVNAMGSWTYTIYSGMTFISVIFSYFTLIGNEKMTNDQILQTYRESGIRRNTVIFIDIRKSQTLKDVLDGK